MTKEELDELAKKPLIGQLKFKIESNDPEFKDYTKACIPDYMCGIILQYCGTHKTLEQPFYDNLIIILIGLYGVLGIHKTWEEIEREVRCIAPKKYIKN